MNRFLGVAVVVASLAAISPATAQERPALYEALEMSGNFSPDPATVEIEAGGDTSAETLNDQCSGMINAEGPDITIDFSQPKAPLNIYVLSEADTTLVVRRPNGDFSCDDDSDGANPWVRLTKPASGRYAIWVGVVNGEDFVPATVLISQSDPDWNYNGGSGGATTAAEPTPRERPIIAFDIDPGSRAETIAKATVGAIESLLGFEPDALILNVAAPVTATDDGTKVRVVLPDARLDSGMDVQFSLGDLAIAVVPRDADLYDITVEVPPHIAVLQGDQQVGAIDYAGAALTGTWSAALQTLLTVNGGLKDLAVTDSSSGSDEVKLRAAAVTVQQTLTAGANGLWQGPYRVELQGAELLEGEGSAIKLGSLLFQGTVEGIDLARWAAIATEFGVTPFLFRPEVASEHKEAFAQAMTGLNLGRLNSSIALADMSLTEGGEEAFRLGELGLRWQMDAREEFGDFGFGFSASGFTVELPDVPAELKPRGISIDVLMHKVPLKALYAAAVPARGTDGDEPPVEAGDLLGVLFQGEPSLSLTNLVLQTGALDLAAKGELGMTANGPRGGLSATIKGLAKTIEALQKGGGGLPGVEEALPALTALRDLQGAAVKGGGEASHQYKIDFTDDGGITVNGKPIQDIMQ